MEEACPDWSLSPDVLIAWSTAGVAAPAPLPLPLTLLAGDFGALPSPAPAPRKEGLARILGTSRDTEIGSEPSPFSCRELGKLALEPLARGRQAENLLCLLGNCTRFVMQFR